MLFGLVPGLTRREHQIFHQSILYHSNSLRQSSIYSCEIFHWKPKLYCIVYIPSSTMWYRTTIQLYSPDLQNTAFLTVDLIFLKHKPERHHNHHTHTISFSVRACIILSKPNFKQLLKTNDNQARINAPPRPKGRSQGITLYETQQSRSLSDLDVLEGVRHRVVISERVLSRPVRVLRAVVVAGTFTGEVGSRAAHRSLSDESRGLAHLAGLRAVLGYLRTGLIHLWLLIVLLSSRVRGRVGKVLDVATVLVSTSSNVSQVCDWMLTGGTWEPG
jgi:hypothetical protein